LGVVKDELERRFADAGMGGGLPGTGAGVSFALFAAAVTRRLTILVAERTSMFSETLRGIGGAAPLGRLGPTLRVDDEDGGGGGGARPMGTGTGGFPLPAIVEGRLGASTDFVRGRRGTSIDDMVDVGRSAREC
jgi:hypothetical protein